MRIQVSLFFTHCIQAQTSLKQQYVNFNLATSWRAQNKPIPILLFSYAKT
jgi:hypothetical protein